MICARFAGLTLAAARAEVDGLAATRRRRLAFPVPLDQFSHPFRRAKPPIRGQEMMVTRFARDGLANSHAVAIPPCERMLHHFALRHRAGALVL
jgi:uncharacterized protein (DUF924 family)